MLFLRTAVLPFYRFRLVAVVLPTSSGLRERNSTLTQYSHHHTYSQACSSSGAATHCCAPQTYFRAAPSRDSRHKAKQCQEVPANSDRCPSSGCHRENCNCHH